MTRVYKLPVMLEPQPEGGYTITCPLVPGLVTEADTLDEVVPNVTDALSALIEGYEALNRPLPPGLQSFSPDTPVLIKTLIAVAAV